jgi:hypothetical protein
MRPNRIAGDVVFGLRFLWSVEKLRRLAELDQLPNVEEGRFVGDAAGLLHVVGHDHDRVFTVPQTLRKGQSL